jgi:hypothetical protein
MLEFNSLIEKKILESAMEHGQEENLALPQSIPNPKIIEDDKDDELNKDR